MAIAVLFLTVAKESSLASEQEGEPVLHDQSLALEVVAEGLESPTSMAFVGGDRLLVLQKNDGKVRLVLEGKLAAEPILQVDVASEVERGLLGIAVWNKDVFLYMTEKGDEVRNRVYKYGYDFAADRLVNRTLVLDLPGEPGPYHNGGKIAIGPDGHLYAVIGDVNAGGGMLDNQIPGRPLDDKSVVLRVDRDTGEPVEGNPFYNYRGDMEKLKRYYAYGIRNSFGIDFDPVSHRLWMTENGPDSYDEINIVEPGFNSGWHKITGPIARANATLDDLNIFDGAAYQDPVFSWRAPVGVTDIEFFSSPEFGEKYQNNVFAGDINNGNLYFFRVNGDRTGLELDHPELADLVADPAEDSGLPSVTLGERFGRITDIETGPDGCLYVLAYEAGKIYKIKQA
jgi:glucose/arabinose dehydrogenase